MRTVVVCLLMCGLAGCVGRRHLEGARAAPHRHFCRGMWDVSVAGSASAHRIDNEQVKEATTFDLSPQYGYFVTDRLEVLGAVGVEYQKVVYRKKGLPLELDRVKQQNYSVAVGLQYNFDNESKLVPFARLYGGLVKSRKETVQTNIPFVGTASEKDETTAPYFGARLGVRYFIARNICTDIGLGWKRILYDSDFGDDTEDYSLVVGCAFFF